MFRKVIWTGSMIVWTSFRFEGVPLHLLVPWLIDTIAAFMQEGRCETNH
jgi:hypothetical protein